LFRWGLILRLRMRCWWDRGVGLDGFHPLLPEVVTFQFGLWFVIGKLRRACANEHRRGPSTSRICRSLCDRSVRRFAQDDGFVWGDLKSIRLEKRRCPRLARLFFVVRERKLHVLLVILPDYKPLTL
jgi:hypothetical protein